MPMTSWDATWPTLEAWAKPSVDMVPHTGHLSELAKDAQVILEFGIRSGVSTLALLNGLPVTGRMVSVDINPDCQNHLHPAVKADPRITLIWGNALDPKLRARYPLEPDLFMLDAGHEYAETVAELQLASELGAKRLVLHDYLYTSPECKVKPAVDDWLAGGAPYEITVLHQSQWGLLVMDRVVPGSAV